MNQNDTEKRRIEVERCYRRLKQREMKRHIVLIVTLVALGGCATVLLFSEQEASRSTLSAPLTQLYREPAVFWETYQKEAKLVRRIGLQVESEMRGKSVPIILTRAEQYLRRDMKNYVRQGYDRAALILIIRDFRRFAANCSTAAIDRVWGEYAKARAITFSRTDKNVAGIRYQVRALTVRSEDRNRVYN